MSTEIIDGKKFTVDPSGNLKIDGKLIGVRKSSTPGCNTYYGNSNAEIKKFSGKTPKEIVKEYLSEKKFTKKK